MVDVKIERRYNFGGISNNAAKPPMPANNVDPWQPRQTIRMHEINTELIRRAQQGDLALVAELYESFHLQIFRYLYYRVGDLHTAEDLTSEVFERMMRSLPGFRATSSTFQAWIFMIARNLTIDHYRRAGNRQHVELHEDLPAEGADPAAALDNSLAIERLRLAIATLPDEQRDVIVMRFISGLPIADVAAALGRSEDAIKGLQRRGLLALRTNMA